MVGTRGTCGTTFRSVVKRRLAHQYREPRVLSRKTQTILRAGLFRSQVTYDRELELLVVVGLVNQKNPQPEEG